MNRQPILEGEQLALRPLEPGDWDALFAVASDPLIWEQHPMHDRWQEPVFRAFFDDAMQAGGALLVTQAGSGAVLGSSQFRPTPFDVAAIEIGWTFLARSHWGGKINRAMKALMIKHALAPEPHGVPRILFRIGDTNWRSRKAMDKIGGRLTDMVEEGEYQGQPARHVIYEITREGFAAGPLMALS